MNMDVKFDRDAAEKLIAQMTGYCSCIDKEAADILDILEYSSDWNDAQSEKFKENITQICRELQRALNLEAEYVQQFKNKVSELRG